ncbi:hypothetical protein GW17_00047167 [Ensete ventricosum]|nr:hypothetical protein GW17_00047167 [Ensete ventricosum]
MHHFGNSKYWPFPTYLPMGSQTSTFLRKSVMITKSRAKSSFDRFFMQRLGNQNIGHSQCIITIVFFTKTMLVRLPKG